MESKVIYKDLAKHLNKVTSEKDLNDELISLALMVFIDAFVKRFMKSNKDISRKDALQFARMEALSMFDNFIFEDRLDNEVFE